MKQPAQLSLAVQLPDDETFVSFYPGNNAHLITALKNAAIGQGAPFLYFWGAKGSGRSHLLHATCAEVNARDAAAAGVDGVLIVDYPPEECEEFAATLKSHGLDLIFLLAPTSTDERMAQVGRIASGYVYYVSLKGVTGAGHLDTDAVEAMLPRIRAQVSVPVGVGFGIRDAETARAVGRSADAVVIGSKIIQLIEDQPHERVAPVAADFLRGIRQALDA